jgi:3-oxoacyl-[acyl-carrier protein] reductase
MTSVERADIDRIRPGDSASVEVEVTEDLVRRFSALSLDDNPVHLDAGWAREHGFPRPVAHGMVVLAALSRLIGTKLPGPGSIWMDQAIEFQAPVYQGDAIRATVTVERVSRAARVVVLKVKVVQRESGASVLEGTARVKIPQRIEQGKKVVMEEMVALITGSSRGLGKAVALALAKQGMKIVVHYRTGAEEARDVVSEIEAEGGQAVTLAADLADPAAAGRLAELARQAFGRVDVLVHNATPPIGRKPWTESSWDEIQLFLDVYVRAGWQLARELAPTMQERKSGRILFIGSSAAFQTPPANLLPYVTAKSALAGMTRALAVELAAANVTVNMIAPSLLVTEQNSQLGDRALQLAAARTPMKRLAQLEEVAAAVVALAGPAGSFVTGTVLPVTGGELMLS